MAIVGSRRATHYGRRVAASLAARLATAGVPVISGLAFGIDITAHRAALDAGGRSIAVLPGGLDEAHVSPRSHLAEARRIAERGTLLSEYPPGTEARKEHFLARNRLISGLARAVVVIEAELPSGSLITARYGMEQGKDVWAVPGPIDSPTSRGTNDLISQGAYPLTDVEEFIASLGLAPAASPSEASPLLKLLGAQPSHSDELAALADLPPAKLDGELTRLELLGLIRHLGGRYYVRA